MAVLSTLQCRALWSGAVCRHTGGGKSRVYPRWREIQGRTLMPDKSHAPCRASMPELLLLSDGLWQRITLRSDTRIRHSRKGVSKHTNDRRIQESGLQNLPPRVIACFSGCFLLPPPYLEQAKGRLKNRLRFSDGLFYPRVRFVFFSTAQPRFQFAKPSKIPTFFNPHQFLLYFLTQNKLKYRVF